jgi:hypothetical protein
MPGRGEQVGLQAAQALSEPLSQAQLAAKHSGGVVGQEKAVGGFQGINQLVQVPETFRGGAAHSEADGIVQRIELAPAGGSYVYVNNQQHYVPQNYEIKVKKGERVEAGDVLSEGVPNPYIITKHKGIGEGRRYFINAMRDAMGGAGLRANRRNLEILARGLINHVRLTDEMGDNVADDIVPYTTLEHTHQPREGHKDVSPDRAVGMYLERPVLHYTIGTKVRPSVVQTLKDYGIESVTAHTDPVAFEPEMIRGMASLQHDPDWQTRMYGSGQKSSLLDAVHHGGSSTPLGTSFVPGLAKAVNFGQEGLVRQPEPGKLPEEIDPMPAKKPPRHALDLTKIDPLTPAPKSNFSFSHLLKLSDDVSAVRDAQMLMEKVGAELGFVKTAEPGNMSTGQVDRQPAAPKPNVNSPLHAGAGNIPGSSVAPPQPQAATPPAMQVGGRAQRRQMRQQQAVEDPTIAQQRRNAEARHYSSFENQGGYVPGRGIYDPNDSVDQVRAYIGDPNQGFMGGLFGAVVRLFNMIDPNAVGTLTRGNTERDEYRGLSGSMGGVTPSTATASVQPKLPQLPQAQPRPQAPPQVPQQAPSQANPPTPQAPQYQQLPMSGNYDDKRDAAQTALSTYGFWPMNTPLPKAVAGKYNILTHQFANGQIDSATFYQQAEQLKQSVPSAPTQTPVPPAAQPTAPQAASPYPTSIPLGFANRLGDYQAYNEKALAASLHAKQKKDNFAAWMSRSGLLPYGEPVNTWEEHQDRQGWVGDPIGMGVYKAVVEPASEYIGSRPANAAGITALSVMPNTAPELAKFGLNRIAPKEIAKRQAALTRLVSQRAAARAGGKVVTKGITSKLSPMGAIKASNPLGWLATAAQITHPIMESNLVDATWASSPYQDRASMFHDIDPAKYKDEAAWNSMAKNYLLPQPEGASDAVKAYNQKWLSRQIPSQSETDAAIEALATLEEQNPSTPYFNQHQFHTAYTAGRVPHDEELARYQQAGNAADNTVGRRYYEDNYKNQDAKYNTGLKSWFVKTRLLPTFDPDKTEALDKLKWMYAQRPEIKPEDFLAKALEIAKNKERAGHTTGIDTTPEMEQQWRDQLSTWLKPQATPEQPLDFWEEFGNRNLVPKDGIAMPLVNEWSMLQRLYESGHVSREEALNRAMDSYQRVYGH